jgi:hypothetical protein
VATGTCDVPPAAVLSRGVGSDRERGLLRQMCAGAHPPMRRGPPSAGMVDRRLRQLPSHPYGEVDLERHHLVRVARHRSAPAAIASARHARRPSRSEAAVLAGASTWRRATPEALPTEPVPAAGRSRIKEREPGGAGPEGRHSADDEHGSPGSTRRSSTKSSSTRRGVPAWTTTWWPCSMIACAAARPSPVVDPVLKTRRLMRSANHSGDWRSASLRRCVRCAHRHVRHRPSPTGPVQSWL